MTDLSFKPAGLTIAAIVAGIAPAAAFAEAPVKQSPAAKEHAARETLLAAAAKFAPAEPFAARGQRETSVPLGGQLDLFED
jgi:hypothetical protein